MSEHKIVAKKGSKIFTSNREYRVIAESLIKNYWGDDLTQERFFAIPLWELWEMFEKYNRTDKVAFRVRNIDEPARVDGEWVRVITANENVDERDASFSAIEFILTKDELLGDPPPPLNPPTPDNPEIGKGGMIHAFIKGHDDILWRRAIAIVRIGKEANEDENYVCIYQFVDSDKLLIKPPQGNGAGLGLKIPAGSGD